MKVKFRVSVSHDGKRYNSGDVATVPEDLAKLWIGLGFAEPHNAEKARQTAVRRAPRTATKQAAPASGSRRTAKKK